MCPDDDGAAILLRRQRFIALALSGLAAACTSPESARPSPCLDVKTPEDQEKARLQREADEREKQRQKQLEATPTPCLSPPRPPPSDDDSRPMPTTPPDAKTGDAKARPGKSE
jgi:hypothetical protein